MKEKIVAIILDGGVNNQSIETIADKILILFDIRGKYHWYCRFTFKDDKLECYLTEHNNCKTFKELRRWWRIEKPNLKLLSAVRK